MLLFISGPVFIIFSLIWTLRRPLGVVLSLLVGLFCFGALGYVYYALVNKITGREVYELPLRPEQITAMVEVENLTTSVVSRFDMDNRANIYWITASARVRNNSPRVVREARITCRYRVRYPNEAQEGSIWIKTSIQRGEHHTLSGVVQTEGEYAHASKRSLEFHHCEADLFR